ncbi:MAG: Rrf2 family transcriptional regulator [Planctomycetota bacterium]
MLSQTTEYALRAMSCLAYTPEDLTPTPILAKQTRVPSNYLAKVLQSLSQASLIVGRRGVGGGYRLAQPATAITLLDVVNAIDPVGRIESCPLGLPNHGPNLCALHRTVDRAAELMMNTFGGVTLADLIEDAGGARPLCDTEMAEKLSALTVNGAFGANRNGANGVHETNGSNGTNGASGTPAVGGTPAVNGAGTAHAQGNAMSDLDPRDN